VSTTIPKLPTTEVLDVRPGDRDAATEVEGWLQAYASSRDPVLRERIIRVGFSQMQVSRLQRRALPGCMASWWSRDLPAGLAHGRPRSARAAACSAVSGLAGVRRAREGRWESMQVIWMVMVTLVLAFSGVLALALVAHVGDRARRR
jgi:hypothetical protein